MEQSSEGEEERGLTVFSFFGILEAAGCLQEFNPEEAWAGAPLEAEGYLHVKLCFIFST